MTEDGNKSIFGENWKTECIQARFSMMSVLWRLEGPCGSASRDRAAGKLGGSGPPVPGRFPAPSVVGGHPRGGCEDHAGSDRARTAGWRAGAGKTPGRSCSDLRSDLAGTRPQQRSAWTDRLDGLLRIGEKQPLVESCDSIAPFCLRVACRDRSLRAGCMDLKSNIRVQMQDCRQYSVMNSSTTRTIAEPYATWRRSRAPIQRIVPVGPSCAPGRATGGAIRSEAPKPGLRPPPRPDRDRRS